MAKIGNPAKAKHDAAMRLRRDIKAFFRKDPYATQMDCARALGVSKATVWRHVRALREARA